MTVGTEIENPAPLPKQFKHWLVRHGFYVQKRNQYWRTYPSVRSRRKHLLDGCYASKRFVRVLPHLDRMEICDGDFDRWANSVGASICPIPRTQAEFDAAIVELLHRSKKSVQQQLALAVVA